MREDNSAETQGFEPWRAFTPYLVSSEALSTTQPRLRTHYHSNFGRVSPIQYAKVRGSRREAPAARSASQAASIVLPVVMTSSTTI